MKVSQEPGFKPIIITIETEEEAIAMWASLNTPVTKIKISNHEISDKIIYETKVNMFYAFDDIFDPREEKSSCQN